MITTKLHTLLGWTRWLHRLWASRACSAVEGFSLGASDREAIRLQKASQTNVRRKGTGLNGMGPESLTQGCKIALVWPPAKPVLPTNTETSKDSLNV